MEKLKHLTQDTLNKLRKGLSQILFKRYKHGDTHAETKIKQLIKSEQELEQAAHHLNLHWY